MEQARVLDIHKYYRHGGVNWELVKLNFDLVIISAGVGLNENHLIEEQVAGANEHAIPYMTYLIPDVDAGSPESQADHYLDLPGVLQAITCTDVEIPHAGSACFSEPQTRAFNTRIERKTNRQPWMYSRTNIIDLWGNVGWLPEYTWWIAQYLYENWLLKRQFTSFANFLAKWGGQLPPSVAKKTYKNNVKLWQFSSKGPAQQLCANEHTLDPVYTHGIEEADLNVSTIEKTQFMAIFGAPVPPPPPPPAEFPCEIKTNSLVNLRGKAEMGDTVVGSILAHKVTATEMVGDFYHIDGYVHKSVAGRV